MKHIYLSVPSCEVKRMPPSQLLCSSAVMGQTKGWKDQNQSDGTIDWQDDEQLTVE